MIEDAELNHLISLLDIAHSDYTDKSSAAIDRARGKVMLRLSNYTLPRAALPFVAAELESGHDAYLVAAATAALKSFEPKEAWLASLLVRAFRRMAFDNRQVELECPHAVQNIRLTTPLNEIINTLSEFGPVALPVLAELKYLQAEGTIPLETQTRERLSKLIATIADYETETHAGTCCDVPLSIGTNIGTKQITNLRRARFHDQEGRFFYGRQLFHDRISVVTFFYTRCSNPNKCSLTVTRMGVLQKKLQHENLAGRVNVYLISYDSWFDTAEKIKIYTLNRGFISDRENKVLSISKEDFAFVSGHFGLSVNFAGSIINQHSTELYLLDRNGATIKTYKHLQWDEVALMKDISAIVSAPATIAQRLSAAGSRITQGLRHLSAALLTIAIAFFPKCPICWAAYMSMLGISGFHLIPYAPWLKPVLILLFFSNIAIIALRAKRRRYMLPLYLTLLGAAIIIIFQMAMSIQWGVYPGMLLIIAASLMNSAPRLSAPQDQVFGGRRVAN